MMVPLIVPLYPVSHLIIISFTPVFQTTHMVHDLDVSFGIEQDLDHVEVADMAFAGPHEGRVAL